jgi:circadian clock protein KaiC
LADGSEQAPGEGVTGPVEEERVSTGIAGLDDVLHGGFLRNRVYLIHGSPGSGKTTLSLQYILEQARRGESTMYVTLSETAAELHSMARSHGWSLDKVHITDLSASEDTLKGEGQYTVFHPSDVELGETTSAVLEEIERVKPAHVVFDGLSEIRLLARDPLRYRRQILALKQYFQNKAITVVLLDDHATPFGDVQPESVVSGVVVLEKSAPAYGKARRRLIVNKVRGTDFRDGYHDYELKRGGMMVYPRLVAADHHIDGNPEPLLSRVAGLDLMLKGGLEAGTVTLLIGPSGVGKSTIAMQYVVTALMQGQKAAVYTFDEVLDTLFHRSEKLVGNIRQYAATGQLHAAQVDPAELSPGAFAYEVRRVVEEGAKVVVIDSMNGYMAAMLDERFLTTHLHELFSYLNQQKVVTVVTMAQHGMLGTMQSPADISYLSDTVLLFRYFELTGEVLQALSVFKKRRGPHERTLRELLVTEEGVRVGEPLRNFQGVMTGVPQYVGSIQTRPSEEP